MVCDKCISLYYLGTKKLGKLITPEVKRMREELLENKTTRKVNANMLLEKYKTRSFLFIYQI
jgi:hypothetical protein